jgi:hypothetical protein
MAYDKIVVNVLKGFTERSHQRTLPVPLVDILVVLYDKNKEEVVEIAMKNFPRLQTAIVCCSHWIRVGVRLTPTDLQQYLERGCAIGCKDYEAGIDLIIPVALKKLDQDDLAIDITNPDTYDISAWFVQVKNRKDGLNIPSLALKMYNTNIAQLLFESLDNRTINSPASSCETVERVYHQALLTVINVQPAPATNAFQTYEELNLQVVIQNDLEKKLEETKNNERKLILRQEIEANGAVQHHVLVTQSSGIRGEVDGSPFSFLTEEEACLLMQMREAPRLGALDDYLEHFRGKDVNGRNEINRKLLPSRYASFHPNH